MTTKQRELAEKYGTPDQFDRACNRAVDQGVITLEEAVAAVRKYREEWEQVGKEARSPYRRVGLMKRIYRLYGIDRD